MDKLYYRGLEAVEIYKAEYEPQHSDHTYTIEFCPNCGLISCKVDSKHYNRTWYIDTIEKHEDSVGSIAYCIVDVAGWERKDRSIMGYPTITLGEKKSQLESKQQLCTCDYDTVVRIIGCQCGGS